MSNTRVQVIRNVGMIENEEIVQKTITIRGEQIEAIHNTGEISATMPEGLQSVSIESESGILDGTGLLALPGAIDMHVHFRIPGAPEKEDWVSGTTAAYAGGVTYLCDMPNNTPPIISVAALQEKRRIINEQNPNAIPHGLYMAATEDNLVEIEQADREGLICGVKVYYGTSTGDLTMNNQQALEALFRANLSVPIVIHAEDDSIILKHAAEYENENRPEIHSLIRSREAAISALNTIIATIQNTDAANVHITHISTEEEVALIRKAKASGVSITCDTTPHHLTFTTEDYNRLGNFLRVNPPIREERDRDALWQGLQDGTIDMVGTDHAPHTLKEKSAESYWDVPSGIPGIQVLVPVLLHAVSEGRLTWARCMQLLGEAPAQRFGLQDRGALLPGMRADVMLVDMGAQTIIDLTDQFSKAGWTPYEGLTFSGKIRHCIVGGEMVFPM